MGYLVRVCDDEGPLLGEVVVEVGDDLDRNVRLSCPGWTHDLWDGGEAITLGNRIVHTK